MHVAEGFYPARKEALKPMIDKMLSESSGTPCGIKNISGAIVPHAGYAFSGGVAAKVYCCINPAAKTVIILGTNHTGLGEDAAISRDSWKTPLGVVKTDIPLAERIASGGSGILKFDELAHKEEHSIEVQLPFLQICLPESKIVAISVSSGMRKEEYEKIAQDISDALGSENIPVIASSDFTHFGEIYGFAPAPKNQGRAEWVRKTDAQLIDAILRFDTEKFLALARSTTACGTGPVAALIQLMKKKAKKAELIDYRTSFDVSGSESAIVGYAGIAFGN